MWGELQEHTNEPCNWHQNMRLQAPVSTLPSSQVAVSTYIMLIIRPGVVSSQGFVILRP